MVLKFKTKDQILDLYVNRYNELDVYAQECLGREYDFYMNLLKDCKNEAEVEEVFQKKIELNEARFRKNKHIAGYTEADPHGHFQEILANYGMILFFKENLIDK